MPEPHSHEEQALLTPQEYRDLVQILLRIPGMDYASSVHALLAGIPRAIQGDFPCYDQRQYDTRGHSQALMYLLMELADYTGSRWSPKLGEEIPLLTVLKHALFHAHYEQVDEEHCQRLAAFLATVEQREQHNQRLFAE